VSATITPTPGVDISRRARVSWRARDTNPFSGFLGCSIRTVRTGEASSPPSLVATRSHDEFPQDCRRLEAEPRLQSSTPREQPTDCRLDGADDRGERAELDNERGK